MAEEQCDTLYYETIIKDLQNRLNYQKNLCDDLQSVIMNESQQTQSPPQQIVNVKLPKRKYQIDTPLRNYIRENMDNPSIIKVLSMLPGCTYPSKQLIRAYLTNLFKETGGEGEGDGDELNDIDTDDWA
jgi:hypothetical protein